jgi:site-specific DNA recombinase
VKREFPSRLRGPIERINVVPTHSGLEVELVGEVAHMMRLSAGAECLITEPFASSMKVVAGRGFEPLTFRL